MKEIITEVPSVFFEISSSQDLVIRSNKSWILAMLSPFDYLIDKFF